MNVIINGLDLSDKGITVADVYVSEASPKLIQTDIPGRDGLLDQSKLSEPADDDSRLCAGVL